MGAIEDSPAIRLELESGPEAPALVRGALSSAGEQMSIPSELLDDLKTAVTEACNNVVMHAYEGIGGPLVACMYVARGSVEIVVRDQGVGINEDAIEEGPERGIGLPMIKALAERALFTRCAGGGTEVRMRFRAARAEGLSTVPEDGWFRQLPGDAIVSISPLALLDGVLGRLTRALAARARFSLDRFSDISLATDLLARHAAAVATAGRIAFGLATDTRHLELTIGPTREGASAALLGRPPRSALDLAPPMRSPGSALGRLVDEFDVIVKDGGEVLRLVIDEPRRWG